MLTINFQALSQNPKEWQRPMEMLPERFDSNSPLYLTPSGNKRKSTSFIPFHGGPRVCFGKTLAETQLKILATYMSQKFEFEFEDARYETEIPSAQIDQSHIVPIWLKLKARQQQN